MASSKKPAAKSKAVVGKSKHRSFRLTPKSGLLILLVMVMASSASVMGWNKVKYGSFTASAAYNYYGNNSGIHIRACKYGTSYYKVLFTSNVTQSRQAFIGSSRYSVSPYGHALAYYGAPNGAWVGVGTQTVFNLSRVTNWC